MERIDPSFWREFSQFYFSSIYYDLYAKRDVGLRKGCEVLSGAITIAFIVIWSTWEQASTFCAITISAAQLLSFCIEKIIPEGRSFATNLYLTDMSSLLNDMEGELRDLQANRISDSHKISEKIKSYKVRESIISNKYLSTFTFMDKQELIDKADKAANIYLQQLSEGDVQYATQEPTIVSTVASPTARS